jgi:ABC-type dipeptide/oligopeptide/nickel transport system permease component
LSEVAVLVLLVIDILVAAIACARLVVVARLLGVYAASAAATQGRRMLRIVVMAVFAFFAFLLRAVVSTKFMVACMQQELTASTRASDLNKCGRACFNV